MLGFRDFLRLLIMAVMYFAPSILGHRGSVFTFLRTQGNRIYMYPLKITIHSYLMIFMSTWALPFVHRFVEKTDLTMV